MKKVKVDIHDKEAQESIEKYCDVIVSVVKRLTKEGYDFSKLEKPFKREVTT